MTRDSWHTNPKDDDWKQVTLAHIAGHGQRLWIRCNACGRDGLITPLVFADRHGLKTETPLLNGAAQ